MNDRELSALISESYHVANFEMASKDLQDVTFKLNNKKKLTLEQSMVVILAGFIPVHILETFPETKAAFFQFFKNRMSISDVIFWYEVDPREEFIIDSYEEVRYATSNGWTTYAEQTGSPMAFSILFPYKLYSSGRPKTTMSRYQFSSSPTYEEIIRRDEYLYLIRTSNNNEITKALPVTRYGSNASGGLFYKYKEETKFCGTFYYLEPESKIYLAYNTMRSYPNKMQAYNILVNELRSKPQAFEKFLEEDEIVKIDIPPASLNLSHTFYVNRKALPKDLKMTAMEYVNRWMPLLYDLSPEQKAVLKDVSDIPAYVGYVFDANLYALEDYLDQPLCNLASFMGIEILIFYDMVGSSQIVTEVLDSRSREKSLANLHFPLE